MKKICFILSILSIIILCFSAGKQENQLSKGLTPYQFNLPDFIAIYYKPMPIPKDNPMSLEGVALGRKLFYDDILSADYSMNCSVCHQRKYAFTEPKQFSTGVTNKQGDRNAMTLVNLGWVQHFFWDGRASSLENQIGFPITNPIEMNSNWDTILNRLNGDPNYIKEFKYVFRKNNIDSAQVVKALAQFVRTITSFNSRFDDYYFNGNVNALTPLEEKGLDLFTGSATCNHCHSDVLLTDNFFRNNGIDSVNETGYFIVTKNEKDKGKFKVPTLRNIAITAPYMHDGRYKTLEEVLDFYSNNINAKNPNLDIHLQTYGRGFGFTPDQKEALIAFLKTLTDTTLLQNPSLAPPKKSSRN